MKNIVVYYITILLPLPLLVWLFWFGHSAWFTVLLLVYVLPYQTVTDGSRLVNKHLMHWQQVWKLLIPGNRLEYSKELYLRR